MSAAPREGAAPPASSPPTDPEQCRCLLVLAAVGLLFLRADAERDEARAERDLYRQRAEWAEARAERAEAALRAQQAPAPAAEEHRA